MTARIVGWGVLLGAVVVLASGCQPGLRVAGQAAAPGAGLGESPAPAPWSLSHRGLPPRGAARIWGWQQQDAPGIFTNINLIAQRKPAELFHRIWNGAGLMPASQGKLREDEVWALVDYIWTFMYDYQPARGQERVSSHDTGPGTGN